jgi:hypothetical protein
MTQKFKEYQEIIDWIDNEINTIQEMEDDLKEDDPFIRGLRYVEFNEKGEMTAFRCNNLAKEFRQKQ